MVNFLGQEELVLACVIMGDLGGTKNVGDEVEGGEIGDSIELEIEEFFGFGKVKEEEGKF